LLSASVFKTRKIIKDPVSIIGIGALITLTGTKKLNNDNKMPMRTNNNDNAAFLPVTLII